MENSGVAILMTSPSVLGLPGGIKKPNRGNNLFIYTLAILHIEILTEMGDLLDAIILRFL
jgi:hypothetical protein